MEDGYPVKPGAAESAALMPSLGSAAYAAAGVPPYPGQYQQPPPGYPQQQQQPMPGYGYPPAMGGAGAAAVTPYPMQPGGAAPYPMQPGGAAPYPMQPGGAAPYPMQPGAPGMMPPAGIPGGGMGMGAPMAPPATPPPFMNLPGIGEDGRLALTIEISGATPCDRGLYISASGVPLYSLSADQTAGCWASCTGRAKVLKALGEGGRPIALLRYQTGCVPAYDVQFEVPNGSGGTRMVPMRLTSGGMAMSNRRALVLEDSATGSEIIRSDTTNLTATEETLKVAGIVVAKSKRPLFQLRFSSTVTVDMNALMMAWNRPVPESMRAGASLQAIALIVGMRLLIMMRS